MNKPTKDPASATTREICTNCGSKETFLSTTLGPHVPICKNCKGTSFEREPTNPTPPVAEVRAKEIIHSLRSNHAWNLTHDQALKVTFLDEAADVIEQLTSEAARLRKALENIVKVAPPGSVIRCDDIVNCEAVTKLSSILPIAQEALNPKEQKC